MYLAQIYDVVVAEDGGRRWTGRIATGSAGPTARLGGALADGSPDPSFGPDGSQTFTLTSGGDHATEIDADRAGRLIVNGTSGYDFERIFVARAAQTG